MSNWYIHSKKADFNEIASKFNITPFLARVIRNRDIISYEDIDEYLNGNESYMHAPEMLKGVEEACVLVNDAIRSGDKIRIMGDYDIDGVCASYILKKMITDLNGQADIAIPNRVTDGYGMNPEMVEEAARDGVGLIITCDNGIKANEAAQRAKELGIKLIITDHHEIPDILPQADVIINPHLADSGYPFKDLCGAAVAYKLIEALDKSNAFLDEALMFAGIATIGDVVPLRGENRIFAKEAIKRLRRCTNAGLQALMEVKDLEPSTIEAYHVGFIIGPCINSAGRLKDAALATKLFEVSDVNDAYPIAIELSKLNDERKELTEKSVRMAEAYFNDRMLKHDSLEKVLVIYMPEAHESVAGIVAGRLKERFNRPAFVLTDSEQGIKGSGRSVEAYNMIEAVTRHPEFFKKVGGHKMACGFTLEDGALEDFRTTLNAECELDEKALEGKKWIDIKLPLEYITEEFVNELELIKPFGNGNTKPVFAENGIRVLGYNLLGQNENVLKLFLESEQGTRLNGIIFGSRDSIAEKRMMLDEIKKEKGSDFKIACLYYPEINIFRDMKNIQIIISDFEVSK